MLEPGASRRDKIYNFASCLVDAVGWPLGMIFFSQTTILPVFLGRLGASDFAIGCLPALLGLLVLLPGMLVVRYLGARRRTRGYLIWIAIVERLALLPLAVLTPLWGLAHPSWLLTAVFVCFGFHGLAMGFNQPAYWVVVGKIVPAHWRGRLFGFAGGLGGILCLVFERLLNNLLSGPDAGFPFGYGRAFLIGFVILLVSVLPLGWVREPRSVPEPRGADWHLLHDCLRVWRENKGFRRFLYGQVALVASSLAAPFYVLAAVKHLHAGPGLVAGYTATLGFAGSFGGLAWGAWGDRSGNRIVLLASIALAVLAPLGALAAPSPALFYGVFAALALSGGGAGLAGFNMVMEFAGEAHEIALYTSMYNGVTAIPRAVAPLVGGLLAGATASYAAGFAVSAALALAALLLTLRVAEPRHTARIAG